MPHLFIRIMCFSAVGGLIFVACTRYVIEWLPIGMLVWGVFGARHFSRDIIDIVPAIAHAARRAVFQRWNGRYYTFNGSQVRFCLVDDTVWIVEEDVRKIITPAVSGREQRLLGADYAKLAATPLRAYSERGLLRLLDSRLKQRACGTDMKKFYLWLQTEAIPNVKRLPTSSMP
jgi:hypothetical protein